MSKHTPGPWLRDTTSGLSCDVRASNGRKVALCWGLSTSRASKANSPAYRAECDANARLIAAAPELLAVIKELQESASYWSEYDVPLGIVNRINSAIAKATGEAT